MQLRSESCSAFNKVGKCHFARGRDGQAESLYVKLCEISSKVCHQKVFKSVDFWLELFKKSKIWTFLRHHIGERNLVIGFRLYEIPNLARLLHLVLRLCTAQCKWGSSSCGSICDSWCSSLILLCHHAKIVALCSSHVSKPLNVIDAFHYVIHKF